MAAPKQSIITNHFITAKGQTLNEPGCKKKTLVDERTPIEEQSVCSASPAKRFKTGGLQLSQLDSVGSITFSSDSVRIHDDADDDEAEFSQCCTQPQTDVFGTPIKVPSTPISTPSRGVTENFRGPWLHNQSCIDKKVV